MGPFFSDDDAAPLLDTIYDFFQKSSWCIEAIEIAIEASLTIVGPTKG
jgi:hypothetical protein